MSEQPSPLPHVDQVEPLGPSDEACLVELRAVLEKHNALQRFGVLLLHEHFEIAADEVLVERCDELRRILTITPIKQNSLRGNVLETSWRLDTREPSHRCKSRCERAQAGHRDIHSDDRL